MQPDYSRQTLLKEVGPAGQAKLAASRVLIVGLGGLGSPVIQYLAGAGVGCLGLVDDDFLDASNLHRQPVYAAADVGLPKTSLAAAAALRINPNVRVECHAARFDVANALDLVAAYDLVIDCSDNFRTKFLINDAAVLARRSAVFASVYQFEGQLQVYRPIAAHGCLRCLWPDAGVDGVVGNCAETGVLGPVPGIFGSMQALIALKLLLGMAGQLAGELLLMDFMAFSTTRLRAPRRPECHAPDCAHIRALTADPADLEITFPSLDAAVGYTLVDVRTDAEVALEPAGGRHLEMSVLLAEPDLLSKNERYLLLCASGRRSLSVARTLRARGFDVTSLAGGLGGLGSRSPALGAPDHALHARPAGTALGDILGHE